MMMMKAGLGAGNGGRTGSKGVCVCGGGVVMLKKDEMMLYENRLSSWRGQKKEK